MISRDDLLAFLRSLLDTRYRRHLAEGLPDATARREALRDVEEWTRALDDGTLEFLEWIPTAGVDSQAQVEVQRIVNPTQMRLA